MKKNAKIIVAALSATVIVSAAAFAGYYIHTVNKDVSLPEKFTITAHTGCEGSEDNSLEAIRLGHEKGAQIVEFDLNFNSEGLPVLAHDDDEAENDCVTLDEAFECVAKYDGLRVNVDVKTVCDMKQVVALAEKHGIKDRIFYTGIEEDDVAAVKELTPKIDYFLNVAVDKSKKNNREYIISLADKVESLGAVGINMKYTGCSEELVSVFHERGLLVSIWTVNSKFAMQKYLPLAPDNITTRHPSALKSIIAEKIKNKQ